MSGLERWYAGRKRLRNLPRWAQVQFACRCARRALRFYPGRPEHRRIISKAILIAEMAAAHAATASRDVDVEQLNQFYAREDEAAKAGEIPNSYYAAAAAFAAYLSAMDTPARDAVCVCSQDAAEMALLACKAFHGHDDAKVTALALCIIEDLIALEKLAGQNCWTDSSAVPGCFLLGLNGYAGDGGCGGLDPSVNMVLKDDPGGNSIIISVNSASESLRNEILSRIGVSIQAILHSYAHEPAFAGAEATGPMPAPDASNELLSEPAYRLLKRLGDLHCKVNRTTWCNGIIHRGNATKYIEELEFRGFLFRDAHNLFSISQTGREHLANHPRKPMGGTESDS